MILKAQTDLLDTELSFYVDKYMILYWISMETWVLRFKAEAVENKCVCPL